MLTSEEIIKAVQIAQQNRAMQASVAKKDVGLSMPVVCRTPNGQRFNVSQVKVERNEVILVLKETG